MTAQTGLVLEEPPLKQQTRPRPQRAETQQRVDELFAVSQGGELSSEWFDAFFGLPVEVALSAALSTGDETALLATPGCSLLFRACVERLRKGHDTTQVLFVLLRRILAKSHWPRPTIDILVLLCGSLEQSDAEMTAFVTAIDTCLSDVDTSPTLRKGALEIALLFVAGTSQGGAATAYFLRRDLFRSLSRILGIDPCSREAALSRTLIGMLANYRRFEARNAMVIRLEDLVDEGIMQAFMLGASSDLVQARSTYTKLIEDGVKSFVATLATLFSQLYLGEIFRLPKGTTPKNGATLSTEELALKSLPLRHVVVLLPIYTLAISNPAFVSLLFADPAGTDFLIDFTSFASYLFCHSASASARARAYCRLCVLLLQRFMDEDVRFMLVETRVRLCRQRQPTLPSYDEPRPLLCSVLDLITLFVRHNLARKLDIDCYGTALILLHKIMHALKTARIRLEYSWLPLWQALLTLTAFVVSRRESLAAAANITRLHDLIITCLDFGCVWGEASFLQDVTAGAELLFELVRCAEPLRALCDLASPSVKTSTANLRTVMDRLTAMLIVSEQLPNGHDTDHQQTVAHDAADLICRIKVHAGDILLQESSGLESVRPYEELSHAPFFRELSRICAADALQSVLAAHPA